MPNPIRSREVDVRFTSRDTIEQSIKFRIRRVRQKHRASLRVQHFEMRNTIILLIRPSKLVLSDRVGVVLRATRHCHETKL